MSQIKRPLIHENKSLSNGTILTFNVPSFDTIDDVMLRFTNAGAPATKANIISSIGKISLNLNGEQVINTTILRLYDFYASLGNEVNQNGLSNVISLNLGRLLFMSPENEDFFSWGCSNIKTIQVQIYCQNTVTSVTDCELLTERRQTQSALGSYIKLISYPQAMSAAGISTVDTLPRDSNEAYLSILAAANAGGAIKGGECVVNGVNVYDPIGQDVNDYIVGQRNYGKVNGYFNYLFADRSIKGLLPMLGVTELRLKTEFATPPTQGVYDLLACSIKNIPAEMLAAVSR